MQIEDDLRRLDMIEEVIVFGQNQESPGVLVFPTSSGIDANFVIGSLHEINSKLPAHARIAPELVVFIEHGRDWPKSSKGTALRSQAEKIFWKEIECARKRHEGGEANGSREDATKLDAGELELIVAQTLESVVGRKFEPDEDFFMSGVDSIMTATIRKMLMSRFNPKNPLPTNAVFEQRTIQGFDICCVPN